MSETIDLEKNTCSRADYSLLGEFSDTILFLYDYTDKRIRFTANIEKEFPECGTETDGADLIRAVHPEDQEQFHSMLLCARKKEDGEESYSEVRFLDRNGLYRWMSCEGHLLQEEPRQFVGKITDIQKQKMRERKLLYKASVDKMTGALNRETTEKEIARLLEQAQSGTLFMVDIDEFKSVNDSLGHFSGDDLLLYIVEEMKREFRRGDIIGRIGGDEFVVFVPELTEGTVADEKARILLERFAGWEKRPVTASIGIAMSPKDGEDYETLYEAADTAMYRAKRHGKNRHCIAGGQ